MLNAQWFKHRKSSTSEMFSMTSIKPFIMFNLIETPIESLFVLRKIDRQS